MPYNPKLLVRYQAHVNVEYCNKGNSNKYLFKNNGPNRALIEISNQSESETVVDEIKQYYDCRYLAPCEAVIFQFDIHHRWPPSPKAYFSSSQ